MRRPETRYALSGDVNVAYQVTGEQNAVDLVSAPGAMSHLELDWDWPEVTAWIERLSGFARLIRFDKRGTGLSDRVTDAATFEERMDDIRAVMDATESREAVVMGHSDGGNMAALFAATYPERTRGLILFATQARWTRTDDFPYPVLTVAEYRAVIERLEREGPTEEWLFGFGCGIPRSHPEKEAAVYRYARSAVSPAAIAALERMNLEVDMRATLALVRVPTLVVNASGDPISPLAGARWIADTIPGARLVTFEGTSHAPGETDDEEALDAIQHFVTGVRPPPRIDRVLATVLFTDIVGSTELATQLGDQGWKTLLSGHRARVRQEIARFSGREVSTTGDGFLATFDGPERAIRCASAINGIAGIPVRTGLHAGEVEVLGDDIAGIAVHIAARVMALAVSGQVLMSRTVRDLVVGSSLRLVEAGTHPLKGVDGEWQVYELAGPETRA
jgi:class 3 adenylate cyclase